MKLTPAMLAGKAYTETVRLKDGDNIYEIEIRPMTHLEKAQVQAIETASVKINNKSGRVTSQAMEMDAGKVILDQAKAKLKMIELATVDETWNEQTINELFKPEWLEHLVERIAQISGMEQPENLNSFRKE